MVYTTTTWSDYRQKLSDHLDPLKVFFSDNGVHPEVGLLLVEALREWNCLVNKYKKRITLNLDPTALYYDLHTLGDFPMIVTDQQIVMEMTHHLLEPEQALGFGGTAMFTQDEIWGHLNRCRNQFLMDTGILLAVNSSLPLIAGETLTSFSEGVIDCRRVVWRQPNGTKTHLWRGDEFESDTSLAGWRYNSHPFPVAYSILRPQPLQLRIMPGSTTPGVVDVLATRIGAPMVPLFPTWIGVPDDLSWGIKWGVIGDLMSHEEQSRDPMRALYAKKRYEECVEIAKNRSIVTGAQIEGKWLPVGTMHDLDAAMPRWMNTTGPPRVLGTNGYTLAVGPIPDQPYKITLDIVESTTYDFNGCVQLGLEEIDIVLEMAHHLGSFKQGGMEFQVSEELHKAFIEEAALVNSRIRAMSIFKDVVDRSGRQEEVRRKRVTELDEEE